MKRYLLTIVFIVKVFTCFAVSDTVKNVYGKSKLVAGTILLKAPADAASVTGSRFASLPLPAASAVTLESSSAIVEFSIDKGVRAGIVPNGTPSVSLKITSWVYNGLAVVSSVENVTLDLDINHSKSKVRAYWLKKSAHQLKVEVLSVSGIPASGWDLLELSTAVITNAYDDLAPVPAYTNLKHAAAFADGNLNVSWDAVPGAESYELEWTYVAGMDETSIYADPDPAAITMYTPDKVLIEGLTFRNNSSRVVLKGLAFNIPLVYEKGYVLYRLRAVGKRYTGTQLVEYKSAWSKGNESGAMYLDKWKTGTNDNYVLFNGLETLKNWQSSISFAEEGKTKTVVTYHDGSMRNRQAVTRINSDNRSIVGETLYDYAGRPVIQLLPVPVNSVNLTYFNDFNTTFNDASSTANLYLKKDDYILTSAGNTCASLAPKFASTTGASNYYSPDIVNNFADLGNGPHATNKIINRDLIPDAALYPYTQTEYKLDNTGRINAQSGVGENHTLGGGHDTKYLYETPGQTDLTRLFGTQVGNASHYKKNLVIDPNGQVSVSYLDLDGKVIATALSGSNPPALDALPGPSGRANVDEVLKGNPANQLNTEGTEKTFTKKIAVANDNTPYDFKYSGTAVTYDVNCDLNPAVNKKFDGVLGVELTLKDKCGTELLTNNATTTAGNSGTDQKLNLNPKITLGKGEYTLTKTLKVNESAIDKYWADFLANGSTNCLKTLTNFETEAAANVDVVACQLSCDECKALYNSTSPTNRDKELIGKLCRAICDEYNPCNVSLDAMKADMSPGGQYGQIRKEQATMPDMAIPKPENVNDVKVQDQFVEVNEQSGSQPLDPSSFPLSIYNPINVLPAQLYLAGVQAPVKPSWKKPVKVIFKDKTGITDSDVLNGMLWGSLLENIQSVTYEITDYYNPNPQHNPRKLATVKVVRTGSSYSPEIDPDGQSYFTQHCGIEDGQCEIPVKYLANFADFNKLWKQEWGAYLLPYHPEFKYYLNCVSNIPLYSFDIKVGKCSTAVQAVTELYATKNTAGTEFYPDLLAKDPIRNYIDSTDRAWVALFMNHKKDHYQYAVNPAGNFSIIEMATSISRCPNGLNVKDACATDMPVCKDNKLLTDGEWLIYRNLYLGERQKIIRKMVNEKAAKGLFYNGCIGHAADYLQHIEAEPFKRPVKVLIQQNIQVRDCPGGWRGWFCNKTKTVSVNSLVSKLPYNFENQACYLAQSELYAKKHQVHFPTFSASSDNGSKVGTKCAAPAVNFTYKDQNGNDVTEAISEPCSTDVAKAMQTGITAGQRKRFVDCGLCPIASELQSFLVQLFDTRINPASKQKVLFYQSAPIDVNCNTSKIALPGMLGDLFKVTGATSMPYVTWNSALSTDKKTMNGSIVCGNKKINITLSLPAPTAANGLRTPITLDSILSVCCLDINRLSNGQNLFYLKANYLDFNRSATSMAKVVYLNGSLTVENLTLNIDACTFPPLCAPSEKANAIASFMSLLSLKVPFTAPAATKQSELMNPNHNLYDSDDKLVLYGLFLRNILAVPVSNASNGGMYSDIANYLPSWKMTSVVGNKVNGKIEYTVPGASSASSVVISIDFTNSGYTFSADNFVEFTSLEPDPNDAFNIKAEVRYKQVINNVTSYLFAPVSISASVPLSICKPVVRPATVVPQ